MAKRTGYVKQKTEAELFNELDTFADIKAVMDAKRILGGTLIAVKKNSINSGKTLDRHVYVRYNSSKS